MEAHKKPGTSLDFRELNMKILQQYRAYLMVICGSFSFLSLLLLEGIALELLETQNGALANEH